MKLKSVRITDFRSIRNTGEFEVGNITCLVGKNEAGKTAVLQALHRLNPLQGTGTFSVTDDYPRADVSQYEQEVKAGTRTPATVVSATFELEKAEQDLITTEYGEGVLLSPLLVLERGDVQRAETS
jgi:predicted ATP-dependent endonuclease of OLD family